MLHDNRQSQKHQNGIRDPLRTKSQNQPLILPQAPRSPSISLFNTNPHQFGVTPTVLPSCIVARGVHQYNPFLAARNVVRRCHCLHHHYIAAYQIIATNAFPTMTTTNKSRGNSNKFSFVLSFCKKPTWIFGTPTPKSNHGKGI